MYIATQWNKSTPPLNQSLFLVDEHGNIYTGECFDNNYALTEGGKEIKVKLWAYKPYLKDII